ncbi:P-type ATPase related protein [Cyclospora cayetanensis]|uniref:P-type ATPase related protein n=1 Tax=Cyclospora cayetanensis TaxID=88456 RepID=A0A1D3D6K7_9EIME|nr:P-type ATPase related protein [Cyclospora cayetanensis]
MRHAVLSCIVLSLSQRNGASFRAVAADMQRENRQLVQLLQQQHQETAAGDCLQGNSVVAKLQQSVRSSKAKAKQNAADAAAAATVSLPENASSPLKVVAAALDCAAVNARLNKELTSRQLQLYLDRYATAPQQHAAAAADTAPTPPGAASPTTTPLSPRQQQQPPSVQQQLLLRQQHQFATAAKATLPAAAAAESTVKLLAALRPTSAAAADRRF